MMSSIFMHFLGILSKPSLTSDIFSRALSNLFFKSKIPLGYPKNNLNKSINNMKSQIQKKIKNKKKKKIKRMVELWNY